MRGVDKLYKVMGPIYYNYLIKLKWLIYIIFFEVIALGIHTALEPMFPLSLAVLELSFWNSFQFIGHRYLNTF